MSKKTLVLFVLVASLAWVDRALRPPPPKLCGSSGGPSITAPRIRLRDGRHLAYKEYGVPKEEAKHNFIFIHGFDSCRHHAFIATEVSSYTIESLGLHIVGFDRPGYGESTPDPNRTPKSLALDVEELADQLGLGPKFYVVGYSMGGEAVWGLLKYIPHRYDFNEVPVRQQGVHESIHRDMIVGFGKWVFDPIQLTNPFPNNEGTVHLWQGDEDMLVPVTLQRYIAQRLPWVHYHELHGAGHMFPYAKGLSDAIIKSQLFGEK
uniref:AB hydrolase-1 domain-containing protein n=1 Tax=Chenopodium quinoa TaxID=63459 RepID=A0A803L2S8_CHEQI